MPIGLRALHKEQRRRAILDAVRELLRERPGEQPTKERIAARAEVAPATVYNLIGPREQLWQAIADELMDELSHRLDPRSADPVKHVLRIVGTVVDLFVEDPAVWVGLLSAWEHSGLVLRGGPGAALVTALDEARRAGVLRREANARRLAASITTACVGAAHQWAAGQLDGDAFRTATRRAAELAMAAAATDAHRKRFARAWKGR